MQISIVDPFFQTALFSAFLLAIIFLTSHRDKSSHEMNISHTNELKGVAILMVIFSHIGYFLFENHKFLYPLSVAGGIGVNIFLFLSGFGLTLSEIKNKKSLSHFYLKRLKAIFVPMWLVLIITLLFDAFLLKRTYSFAAIIQSILGFFPNGDIDSAINSPLWYFSLILFYYLIFPLVYLKKKPLVSAVIILVLGYFVINLKLPVSPDVLKLYSLHYVAFPLGMVVALVNLKKLKLKIKSDYLRYLLVTLLLVIFGYTAIHSGIGETISKEQLTSLVSLATLILVVLIKNIQSRFLIILGKYSYEIYLIQWPLLYRFDFIYKYTPPFLGTLLYLGVFIIIGYVLNRIVNIFIKLLSFSPEDCRQSP